MQEPETPVQSPGNQHGGGSKRGPWRVLGLLLPLFFFGGIFAVVYWLTPVRPYATLSLKDGCGLVLFSPDSKTIITTGKKNGFGKWGGPVHVWDVQQGVERFFVAAEWQTGDSVQFSPDSRLFAAYAVTGVVKLWHTMTCEQIAAIPVTRMLPCLSFCFSPDSRFLVMQYDNKGSLDEDHFTFWNIDRGREVGSVEGQFCTLALAPDGITAATFSKKDNANVNRIRLWKIDETGPPVLDKEHRIVADSLAFSPDVRTIAVANNLPEGKGEIALWDMTTGMRRCSMIVDQEGAYPKSLSFAANGKILVEENTFLLLESFSQKMLWDVTSTPRKIGSCVTATVISPDGGWLAVPTDFTGSFGAPPTWGVKLVRTADMEEQVRLIRKGDIGRWLVFDSIVPLPSSTFSPDSSMVAIGGLNTSPQEPLLGKWLPAKLNPFPSDPGGPVVRVWDVATGKELMGFEHCSEAHFSPDGNVLATLHEDHTIKLWQLPFRKPVWRMLGWTIPLWLVTVLFWRFLVWRWRKMQAR